MKTSSLQLPGARAICPSTHNCSLLFKPQKAVKSLLPFISSTILSPIRRFLMALSKGGGSGSFAMIVTVIHLHPPQPSNRRREAVPGWGTCSSAPTAREYSLLFVSRGDCQKPPTSASRLAGGLTHPYCMEGKQTCIYFANYKIYS